MIDELRGLPAPTRGFGLQPLDEARREKPLSTLVGRSWRDSCQKLFLFEESKKGLRLQVSAKGGASLYGIRRFPITFYKDEWETILGKADDIRSFLKEHADELKTKG